MRTLVLKLHQMILSEGDQLKERIKFKTEVVKVLLVVMVTTTSGALSLVLYGAGSRVENLLAVSGIILAGSSLAILLNLYFQIIKLIKNGNE